ncbi:MAG: hypothetical protein JWM68_2405 [Verrucomicrobiales bacterium]|nr:hypothetical protein [Verrucomicrobiales bacterium]
MNKRTLLHTFLFVLLCISPVLAELPSDTETKRQLVGDWVADKQPGLVAATTKFKPDGTFSSDATFMAPDGQITIKVEGKWRVERGVLIEELTRSSHPNIVRPGLVTRDTLISLTKDKCRYRNKEDKEHALLRAADAVKPLPEK